MNSLIKYLFVRRFLFKKPFYIEKLNKINQLNRFLHTNKSYSAVTKNNEINEDDVKFGTLSKNVEEDDGDTFGELSNASSDM